eukprot:TRINITY_DN312_c0_g3_i4.p1 TRINITY_DN312_c0_g3~~TRINITY_DN312_c0_g3_i4.p1  ORF type:complete len:235 (+),score=83.83 TRINITY_DN312_c0_g3_i4:55-759(+)
MHAHSVLALLALATAAARTSALTLTGTLGPGAPGQITSGTAQDGMTAYSQADISLTGFKTHQLGGPYLDLGAVAVAGSTVTVTASADKPAMLYASVFSCWPCPHTQGNLVGHVLNNEGWRLGYCAPVFFSAARGRAFRQVSFAKDVAAGESYTLTLPAETQYVSFFATENFVNCPSFGADRATCQGASEDMHCKWDAETGTCEFAYCHGNVGPSQDLCSMPDACATSAWSYYQD